MLKDYLPPEFILFLLEFILFLLTTIAYLLIILIFLYIPCWIARWIALEFWTSLKRIYSSLDYNKNIKLIGLTILAIFIAVIRPRIFNLALSFCLTLVFQFWPQSLHGWMNASRVCIPENIDDILIGEAWRGDWLTTCGYSLISEVINSFLSSFELAFSKIEIEIHSFPFRSLLIFLTIMFVVARFFNAIEEDRAYASDGGGEPKNQKG